MTNPYAPPSATVSDVSDPTGGLTPADRGTRLGAAILDTVVIILAVYLPMLIGLAAVGFSTTDAGISAAAVPGVLVGASGFFVWLYFTVVYVRANGQTIAKKWLNIKVVRSDGTPASLGRIFWLRNVVNGLLSILPLYGIIDSLFIFGESRQCLHDKIADTIVVDV
jgi:uncharacterized RDD family membrane protein YckC